MPFDDGLDDREAEAAAGHLGGAARRVGFVEPLEDMRQVLGWNARAVVAHDQPRSLGRRLRRKRQPTALGRMAQGVGGEILQRLLEPLSIGATVRSGGCT